MTLGFAMLVATFMVAVVAAIMAVCYALVWLLLDHPIALVATTAFMIWMLVEALIYNVWSAPSLKSNSFHFSRCCPLFRLP